MNDVPHSRDTERPHALRDLLLLMSERQEAKMVRAFLFVSVYIRSVRCEPSLSLFRRKPEAKT